MCATHLEEMFWKPVKIQYRDHVDMREEIKQVSFCLRNNMNQRQK